METDLFVHFAEIAGVFVGFGALISLRIAQLPDVHDVVYLRGVLGLGVWVVIAALVPIAISRYGVLGVWRTVDEALYVTALAAGVVFAGYTLLTTVMSQKHGPGRDGGR